MAHSFVRTNTQRTPLFSQGGQRHVHLKRRTRRWAALNLSSKEVSPLDVSDFQQDHTMASDASSSCSQSERDSAYFQAVPLHGIAGLYPGFSSALTVLRIARTLGELNESLSGSLGASNSFFEFLSLVERALSSSAPYSPKHVPFVVVVEGIDGAGKSFVVQELARSVNLVDNRRQSSEHVATEQLGHSLLSCHLRAVAMATPTEFMNAVRPVFDQRGGAVARAFYMVSNYVLQHEIQQLALSSDDPLLILVDRWYGSMLAYSLGWKNTTGGPNAIDDLLREDTVLFQWPKDLLAPDLMLILEVNAETRKQRVLARNQQSEYNPWDGRLHDDDNLGLRITRVLELVSGPRESIVVDANLSKDLVLQAARDVVLDRVTRHFEPWKHFARDPLTFFVWSSAQWGLCDRETGRRNHHKQWAIQISTEGHAHSSDPTTTPVSIAPALRTVGIHSVNRSGILFFTWGHPSGPSEYRKAASIVCVGGDYPHEQQWRAEGILCPMSDEEGELMGTAPPFSLAAQIASCSRGTATADTGSSSLTERLDCPASQAALAAALRQQPDPEIPRELVRGTRFVPMRMEVLMGGPGGPRRFEWTRPRAATATGPASTLPEGGWTAARAILPFSRPNSVSHFSVYPAAARSITLVLTGTHCAGKATLGKRTAQVLGWIFHPELGEVLRDAIVPGGHRVGYGFDDTQYRSWDDQVHTEEVQRDSENMASHRVVETWHLGNLAWAHLRRHQHTDDDVFGDDDVVDPEPYWDAAQADARNAVVLCVHLRVTVETSVRRRRSATAPVAPSHSRTAAVGAERLPMERELEECRELHAAIGVERERLLEQVSARLRSVPTLVLDNSLDGEAAIRQTTQNIVQFVNENLWRTVA